MRIGLMIVIAAVFILTIAFAMLIIKQFGSFQKQAMKAKLRQDEYLQEYLALKAEEERKLAEEERRKAEEERESSEGETEPIPGEINEETAEEILKI